MAFSMIVFAMCEIVSESVVQIADKSHYVSMKRSHVQLSLLMLEFMEAADD